ncbi:FAD binding domain-containing protein [Cyathus striatus]|nr:FAD binding domain-containing protein [Cyathus striatus]
MNASVLIVGAGPSGLVLALSLLQNGVSVRIIDKETSHRVGERGAGMMPRTLELHNLLGTLPDIQKIAGPTPKRRAYGLPGIAAPFKEHDIVINSEPTPDTPFPNSRVIGQNHLESILREHMKKYSIEVELGTALEKFEQFDDHVTVHLVKTVDGKEYPELANFSYLVGADGAHSVVRKQLGLSFLGETMQGVEMKIGDIIIKEGLTRDCWHFWGDFHSKMVSLRPSGQDLEVYSFIITGIDLRHVTATSGREDFINAIEEVTGRKDLVFGDLVWINNYRPNVRMVNKFHVGRVFIAGDAAHCHSPTGGQGMNSSSQDSFNLGWKLALVVKGLAPPSILDTYDEERSPVIAEMLSKTTKILKQTINPQTDKDEELAWARGGELRMLGVNYRTSSIVIDDGPLDKFSGSAYNVESATAARAGDRAPDAPKLLQVSPSKEETSLFQLFGSSYHTVLVFGGSAVQHRTLLETVEKLPKGVVKTALVIPKDNQEYAIPEGFDPVVVDTNGHAFKGYSVSDGELNVVVVRPDGVVGARVGTMENFEKYFSRILL